MSRQPYIHNSNQHHLLTNTLFLQRTTRITKIPNSRQKNTYISLTTRAHTERQAEGYVPRVATSGSEGRRREEWEGHFRKQRRSIPSGAYGSQRSRQVRRGTTWLHRRCRRGSGQAGSGTRRPPAEVLRQGWCRLAAEHGCETISRGPPELSLSSSPLVEKKWIGREGIAFYSYSGGYKPEKEVSFNTPGYRFMVVLVEVGAQFFVYNVVEVNMI
ncbi:isoaspartyl dipeptidase [Striga asiatica]|uniref:Isoaspartyl dipeptidase n=1 Tax=Striga asiatica TaxID=4170 RepID=A0A5A7P4N9_STRAF|nr:isoaspartyl dipeptidase [Striga asiatica]